MREPADVAVGRLFDEHGRALYRLGVRFCGSADEAQDLVQDVFLQAFRSWEQFDGRSAPSTWLYTIAARRCQRRHRRRAGEPRALMSLSSLLPASGDPVVDLASDSSPFDEALRAQMEERVAVAIAALPAVLRLPLILADIADVPLEDVARVLGVKIGTVKSRVHRARLRVRQTVAAALPSRTPAPPEHERRFCLDLLTAKQEAMDRGVPFPVRDGDVCERCRSLFATLDLTRDTCRRLAAGDMPAEVAALARGALTPPASPRRRNRRPAPSSGNAGPGRTRLSR
jgi:RNA polymerase sigma-70 factor (ECF subfamily)